jgi:hypothetical protein
MALKNVKVVNIRTGQPINKGSTDTAFLVREIFRNKLLPALLIRYYGRIVSVLT